MGIFINATIHIPATSALDGSPMPDTEEEVTLVIDYREFVELVDKWLPHAREMVEIENNK